jgi:hypothetical protein
VDLCEDAETVIGAVVRCKPAGGLGEEWDDEEHGDDTEALENDWDSPGIAAGVGREGIVDPVDEEDTKVQSRQLSTDV